MSKEASIKSQPLLRELEPTLSTGSVQSCFRNRNENVKNCLNRRVSFAEDEKDVVTGFLEPANPWEYADNVNKEEVISNYLKSCEKHGARPINSIIDQLQDIDYSLERNDCLDLKGKTLSQLDCETLEEILKRVQFVTINLESTSIDDESSVALFDMVEYYEAAIRLNISGNHSIGIQGWQACSRMIKRTKCLEELEARNTTLNEHYMPILSRALRLSSQLVVLKLENCNLSGRPVVILAAALRLNTGLKELYLAENCLGVNDASQLGAMLKCNTTLQLLDISNNNVQDDGMKHMTDGLHEQSTQSETGLGVLVVWNNHLTLNSSPYISRILDNSKTLEILNIGQNILSNDVLFVSKKALQQNRTLLRLGMQSTHLTCEGAIALAEIIADNSTIERIDLRDNNLQVAGLMALVHSMKVNSSVTQLDLDDSPRRKYSGNVQEEYARLVKEIRGYCHRNENTRSPELKSDEISESSEEITDENSTRQTNYAFRKISLTCETLMRNTSLPPVDTSSTNNLLTEPRKSGGRLRSPAPSPIPSPVASPSPTRSRFQVSRVSESDSPTTPPSASPSPPTIFFGSGSNSRFRVTVVDPSAAVSSLVPTPVVASNNVTKGFNTGMTTIPRQPSSTPPTVVNAISNTESIREPQLLKAKSDTILETEKELPKSKLPKAMDSLDLSSLRIIKQATISEKPLIATTSRSRKISWVQPSSMLGLGSSLSSSQDEGSNKMASGLEKLLGLFHNPFSRQKQEEEPLPQPQPQPQTLPVPPQQQLSRVPELSEKPQNCDTTKTSNKDYNIDDKVNLKTNLPIINESSSNTSCNSDTASLSSNCSSSCKIVQNIIVSEPCDEVSVTVTETNDIKLIDETSCENSSKNNETKETLSEKRLETINEVEPYNSSNSSTSSNSSSSSSSTSSNSSDSNGISDNNVMPDILNNNNNNYDLRREGVSETWPQGRGCVSRINQSLDAQSNSAPCLTALVLLQGNVSSDLLN
ncbi:uncharacterized protein LOC142328089 [Lycorma delicatula]|uniref:uncharacterized protein LOC142328089 n=1 Tax=Lycorma delicatula TaxID=130591 RepID=UPI003F51A958